MSSMSQLTIVVDVRKDKKQEEPGQLFLLSPLSHSLHCSFGQLVLVNHILHIFMTWPFFFFVFFTLWCEHVCVDANVCSQISTFCFVYQLCMILTRQVLLRLCDRHPYPPSFRFLDPGHTCKYAHTDTCTLAPYLFFLFFFLSCRSPNKKPNAPSSGPLFLMCYCTYYTHAHQG